MKKTSIKILLSMFLLITPSIASAENVILINPFMVPPGKLEQAVIFWEKARDFLEKEPGYISTKLHKSLQADATYHLVNIAEWESVETFTRATKKMKEYLRSEKIKGVEGLKYDPALYRVIRK